MFAIVLKDSFTQLYRIIGFFPIGLNYLIFSQSFSQYITSKIAFLCSAADIFRSVPESSRTKQVTFKPESQNYLSLSIIYLMYHLKYHFFVQIIQIQNDSQESFKTEELISWLRKLYKNNLIHFGEDISDQIQIIQMQGLRNIVVTGSNKGIGYGIVENLAGKGGWNIIMACRDAERAKKSQMELLTKFPNASIQVEVLDVSNKESVEQFVKVVETKYKNIDVLLNNAGVVDKSNDFDQKVANFTFSTNFYGTIDLSESLLKYISNSGKIIFVGSMMGKLEKIPHDQIKDRFKSPDLDRKKLFELIEDFTTGVKEGNYGEKGWPKSMYVVSKAGINFYARVLAKFPEVIERKIQVSSCCPGFVNTDMTNGKGILTIQQGALTPVFLAELPSQFNPEYQGQFFEKSALSALY